MILASSLMLLKRISEKENKDFYVQIHSDYSCMLKAIEDDGCYLHFFHINDLEIALAEILQEGFKLYLTRRGLEWKN